MNEIRTRHVFFQRGTSAGLSTLDQRSESAAGLAGLVQQASYLKLKPKPSSSWLQRWLPWLFPPDIDVPSESDAAFVLPFDTDGNDVLDLCDMDVPPLDGTADSIGEIRRATGKIVCLEPRSAGDTVVLRDFWQDAAPVWRIVETLDFGVVPQDGSPVAVCCAMAPLTIAPPSPCSVAELVELLGSRATSVLGPYVRGREAAAGSLLELREGDTVEVTGVVSEPKASVKRFDVVGREARVPRRPPGHRADCRGQPGHSPGRPQVAELSCHELGPERPGALQFRRGECD